MTITGSKAMRNSVSMVGRVKCITEDSFPQSSVPRACSTVECRVDALGEIAAHAACLRELVHARGGDPGEPAEMPEQGRAAFGADARNLLEPALLARFLAPLAMPRDRETMRFVAYALDQVQRGRLGAGPQRFARVAADQRLVSGATFGTFRDPDHEHAADAEIGQHFERLRHLAFAAVDKQHVGQTALARREPLVAPLERLAHRTVVVAGFDAGDVEPAVQRFLRALRAEYDARSHR